MDREEAIRALWEAATEEWRDESYPSELSLAEQLFDSATVLPAKPLKGKELHRIGRALGFIEDPE